jgi:hypothetical protein
VLSHQEQLSSVGYHSDSQNPQSCAVGKHVDDCGAQGTGAIEKSAARLIRSSE